MYPRIRLPFVSFSAARSRLWRLLSLIVILSSLLWWFLVRRVRHPETSGSPAFETDAADSASTMFHERTGSSRNPTLTLTNTTSGEDQMILSSGWQRRTATIPAGGTVTVSLAPGTYRVRLISRQRLYSDWSGRATFRPFKQYETAYTCDTSGPPLHIGE